MKKKILYVLGVFGVVAILVFAYYTISPFFINIKLNEGLPKTIENTDKQALSATLVGTVGHSVSGIVRVVEANNKRYIRYENLKTVNGPDLFIYLAKDLDAKEYVNLGSLRATEGNVNYEIPENVDLREYKYVMVWCRLFGVLFNYAELSL